MKIAEPTNETMTLEDFKKVIRMGNIETINFTKVQADTLINDIESRMLNPIMEVLEGASCMMVTIGRNQEGKCMITFKQGMDTGNGSSNITATHQALDDDYESAFRRLFKQVIKIAELKTNIRAVDQNGV